MKDYKEDKYYDITQGHVYSKLSKILREVPTDYVDWVLDFQVLKFIAKRFRFTKQIINGTIAFGPIFLTETDFNEFDLVLSFLSEHPCCHVKDITKCLLLAAKEAYGDAMTEVVKIGSSNDLLRKKIEFCVIASTLRLKSEYDYKINQEILDYYGKTHEELSTLLTSLYRDLLESKPLFYGFANNN